MPKKSSHPLLSHTDGIADSITGAGRFSVDSKLAG